MRKTAAIALVAVALLGVAGCSDDSPAVEVPTAPTGPPPLPTNLPSIPIPTATP